jgi:hypothetical protein
VVGGRVGMSSWAPHWCCLKEGFFIYYEKQLNIHSNKEDIDYNIWETSRKQVTFALPYFVSI